MGKRSVLIILAAAQFLMVLDQSVMNVSISQLVEDFDTTVTTIQAVITLYSLTMAALMVTGGKLGDIWGRRRAFRIGLVIYGAGSALTALSWSVPTLALGWSILEGIGAALVLPAMVALTAGNFEGKARAAAYGVLGGVAGAGIAVGPILGGWVTTNLTWRLVFAGEVVLVIAILLGTRLLKEPPAERQTGGLDWVGSVLSAPRPLPRRLRRAAVEQLGMAAAPKLADHAARVLARPVRDRGRRNRPGRLPGMGAPA